MAGGNSGTYRHDRCTTGRTPTTTVLTLFALLASDELVTLVTWTVATGKVLGHAHTDMTECVTDLIPSTAVLMLFALLVSRVGYVGYVDCGYGE